MSFFDKISNRTHYYLDSLKINTNLTVKIERFEYNLNHCNITVLYRLGRQKLLNKMYIFDFEKTYFGNISSYDQLRLTKFSTFESLLQRLYKNNSFTKLEFINHIQEESKNEQLF